MRTALIPVFLFVALLATDANADQKQLIENQIADLKARMKQECNPLNYKCRNRFLSEIVSLNESEAQILYKDYNSIRAEIRYKKDLSDADHQRILSDYDALEKFSKYLDVRKEQAAKEFKRIDNTLLAKTALGQVSGPARINDILKNQIHVLDRYKKDIQEATDFLQSLK